MINLEELERMLDAALANETDASMTEWLLNKRSNNIEAFLGSGHITTYHNTSKSYCQPINNVATYIPTENQDCVDIFSLAA